MPRLVASSANGIQQPAALRDERDAARHGRCPGCPPWSRRSDNAGSRCPCSSARPARYWRSARARRVAACRARPSSLAASAKPSDTTIDATHAERRRLADDVEHGVGRHRDDHESGTSGRSRNEAKQRRPPISRIIRIDRPGRNGEAEARARLQHLGARAAFAGHTDEGDRDRGRSRASIGAGGACL